MMSTMSVVRSIHDLGIPFAPIDKIIHPSIHPFTNRIS